MPQQRRERWRVNRYHNPGERIGGTLKWSIRFFDSREAAYEWSRPGDLMQRLDPPGEHGGTIW